MIIHEIYYSIKINDLVYTTSVEICPLCDSYNLWYKEHGIKYCPGCFDKYIDDLPGAAFEYPGIKKDCNFEETCELTLLKQKIKKIERKENKEWMNRYILRRSGIKI